MNTLMGALMRDDLKILMRQTRTQAENHAQQDEEAGKEEKRLRKQLTGLWAQYEEALDLGLNREVRRDISAAIVATKIAIENHNS